MAVYKVINLDSPIESDYWVDIPVRDPATNKDAVDEKGRILVQRHVTRSIKNEELSTFNTAVETLNTLKVDYSAFKEEVSTKVNNHDSNILTNTNSITTLTDSVANHDLQINALYTKINAIQGIDIDDFKYVTETDIKNIKKNYLPLTGGTITGNVVYTGSVSSNLPIKANLQGTADRAIGDINGKALTSYIANLRVSGASLTVINGAGNASNYTVDNVNHATIATICTSKVNSSLTTDTFLKGNQGNVLVNSNASAGTYTMLTKLNSTNGKFTQGCYQNNYLLQYTTNTTVNAGTNSVTKSVTLLNENGDSTFCGVVTAPTFKGALSGNATSATNATNATKATNANHAKSADSATNANHATTADSAKNATNATKATQDSAGQQINTTYVKGVTTSNATITVTKGNGTTSTATINNVANATNATNANHATNADNLGGYPASNYIRRVNGITPDKQGNVQLGNVGAITGEIKWFAFNKAPNGYLVCNGAQVSRTTYADLFKAIGTTFGKGNGSTTFNLPDLRDRYVIGANTNALGAKIAEQLPNIKGSVRSMTQGPEAIRDSLLSDGTGSFITNDTSAYGMWSGTSTKETTRSNTLLFNAHISTSTYVDNGKVYPLSLALLPCIKY